ncbi:hypothetical protein BCR61_00910 [Xanthomonas oryzae pv. oryzae]|nr:hypothetical protein BCR61_00910 [Xanthomonas oryzae pv. oryzae]AXQ73699.1 hypothetical protein BXU03_00895 [Xanthomonas oryzae pv. oryzae]
MGENCQKPVGRVTKTGSSSTPKPQVRPCNGCGLGVFQGRLISPDPQLDFCCSPANSFVLPMCSMMSDLGAADARSRCEVLSARTPWRPGIGPV